jgi:cobaltochelatase CobN
LPTGRNLSTIDARTIPTPTALHLAEKSAAELLRRHQQEHGDWPRSLVLNLWGSATLRTGGEDFALALVLIGVRPQWDASSGRVNGFEVLPLAVLDRPRIDVTLRISGLFRDAFADQVALFDQAVQALARRDEAEDWNSLARLRELPGQLFREATRRVFGPPPGSYGTGVEQASTRAEMAEAYVRNSSFAYTAGEEGEADRAGFTKSCENAEAFVHLQDHRETDILDGSDHAAHEAGFAALGRDVPLYHMDIADPAAPRARLVAEEVARVVRGRAANPVWIDGMRRHGRSGAAEIARPLQALYRFALGTAWRFDRSFDLLYDATLGDASVDRFLREENPQARAAMVDCFARAQMQGLWHPRRNAGTGA